jgi:hypothetical protein
MGGGERGCVFVWGGGKWGGTELRRLCLIDILDAQICNILGLF